MSAISELLRYFNELLEEKTNRNATHITVDSGKLRELVTEIGVIIKFNHP
jgi:hypothetical protein